MSVAVTDAGSGYISINDGNFVTDVEKAKVSVIAFGSTVQIWWGDVNYISFPYTDFTAPSGASASAVAAAIAAFLNTGGGAASNTKTVSYTIGAPGVTGVDYNFTSVANMTEQSIQLGATTIVPANSPIINIVAKCTTAPASGNLTVDVGSTSGGDEYLSSLLYSALNDINSGGEFQAKASAGSVYFSGTPSVNWSSFTLAVFKVWVTYSDNSAN